MPAYATPKLEFSIDPLSDSTPAWTDVTSYLKDAQWFSGIQRDLDPPQAGGATFVLRNKNRDWEPEYSGGRFAGNILPMRRFRWSITADGSSRAQGTYYATSYQVVYPDPGSTESDVVVTCVDGTGILALQALPALDPPSGTTYSDVVLADAPFAYYPLNDAPGKTMAAAAGPEGVFKGNVTPTQTNAVVGSSDPGRVFTADGYGRAKLDDENVWFDSGAMTLELVITRVDASSGVFAAGPWDTTAAFSSFYIGNGAGALYNVGAVLNTVSFGTTGAGTYHLAMTYDGSTLTAYKGGVQTDSVSGTGNIISPDANEFMYVGRPQNHSAVSAAGVDTISHVAFYDYALSPSRIAAHATAATSRGYSAATAGSRIATLATNALWSTASIPAGTITVSPRMQTGQKIFDEIVTTTAAEQPIGIFFFNDAGNPDYYAWEDSTTIQATFGELEVQYDYPGLVYDDQVFNQSTVSGVTGNPQTNQDTTSQGQYGTRTQDATDLIIQYDYQADMVSQAYVDRFSTPMYRIESVDLNGAAQNRRTQILLREIGETIRIKRRGAGGTANPDIVTRIIGKSKHLDVSGNLSCTWTLARGFPAQDAHWRLSQDQYTELGTNTILA